MSKNKEELIRWLEDILEPSYVKNCCRAAWDHLWRVVDGQGGYRERLKTTATAMSLCTVNLVFLISLCCVLQ